MHKASSLLASLGVKAYVRHTHTANEGTWFPSKSDPRDAWHPMVRQSNRSLPREFLDQAKEANITVIFYHYMKCSQFYAEKHPSWVQQHPDGTPIAWKRCPKEGGMSTCSRAWQDTFIAQVVQLAEMGAKGFYFDEFPGNPGGDWSPSCRARFFDRYGEEMPNATVPGASSNLPVAQDRRIHLLMSNITEEYFVRLNAAIRNVNPDIVSLTSVYQVPKISNGWGGIQDTIRSSEERAAGRRVNYGLYETTDLVRATRETFHRNVAAKTEFTLPARLSGLPSSIALNLPPRDILMSLGWAIARDASSYQYSFSSPHVWNPFLNDSRLAECSAAALVAYGCIANLDHAEKDIPNTRVFNSTYLQLGAQLDAKVFGAYPNIAPSSNWAAILFSEKSRNRYLPSNASAAWEVLWPVVGAWEAFVRRGVGGVRIATDGMIQDGLDPDITPLLLVPPVELLDLSVLHQVGAYKKAGGRVIVMRDNFSDANARKDAELRLFEMITGIAGSPDVRVIAQSERINNSDNKNSFHVVVHDIPKSSKSVVFVVNNFTNCVGSRQGKPKPEPAPIISGLTLSTSRNISKAVLVSTVPSSPDIDLVIQPPHGSSNFARVNLPDLTNVHVIMLS